MAFLPIAEPESLCQQFLTCAIEDRQRDWDAIQEDPTKDRFVQKELNRGEAGAQQPEAELNPVEDLDALFAPDPHNQLEPDAVTVDPELRAISLQNLTNPATPGSDEEEKTELPPSTEEPSD